MNAINCKAKGVKLKKNLQKAACLYLSSMTVCVCIHEYIEYKTERMSNMSIYIAIDNCNIIQCI